MKLIDADELIKHARPGKQYGEMLVVGLGHVLNAPQLLPYDEICHDPNASPLERETALLIAWNKTLTELRGLESEVAATLNENAHLADGDDCTLIRLKRAIGWSNVSSHRSLPGAVVETQEGNKL